MKTVAVLVVAVVTVLSTLVGTTETLFACLREPTVGWTQLQLGGRRSSGDTFDFTLAIARGRQADDIKALVVSAVPSGQILAVHWNGEPTEAMRALPEIKDAIATSSFEVANDGVPRFRLRWDPAGTTGYTLRALYKNRLVPIMLNARSNNPNEFRVTMEFDTEPFLTRMMAVVDGVAPALPADAMRPYRACCGCQGGGEKCNVCMTCYEEPPSPICSGPGC